MAAENQIKDLPVVFDEHCYDMHYSYNIHCLHKNSAAFFHKYAKFKRNHIIFSTQYQKWFQKLAVQHKSTSHD